MAYKNSTILGNFMQVASNDAMQRLTDGSQSLGASNIKNIFKPMNGRLYNEFVPFLVNRIGMEKVHGETWTNPLAVFKKAKLEYGTTIEEIAPKWVAAHSYGDDKETLLKMHRPEVEVAYHSLNRQEYYPITINRAELKQAFTTPYGVDNLVSRLLQVPVNSDNYDEYNYMLQMMAYYEKEWGFYKVQLKTDGTAEENARDTLKKLQTFAKSLAFPSTNYNAGVVDIPVFENDPSKLVLLATPEAQADLNVDGLATLFNIDKAEVPYRIVTVNEFPIEGAEALLTTEDFFVFHDAEYTTTDFFNPETLSTNFFLHHWEVISVSPFVPAILFTTKAGTQTATITESLTKIEIVGPTTAAPGDKVQLSINTTGSLTASPEGADSGDMTVAPTSAIWQIAAQVPGVDDEDDPIPAKPIQLNTRTYVDRQGMLHIQKSGLKSGDELIITATSTYANPSGATPGGLTDTHTITIA